MSTILPYESGLRTLLQRLDARTGRYARLIRVVELVSPPTGSGATIALPDDLLDLMASAMEEAIRRSDLPGSFRSIARGIKARLAVGRAASSSDQSATERMADTVAAYRASRVPSTRPMTTGDWDKETAEERAPRLVGVTDLIRDLVFHGTDEGHMSPDTQETVLSWLWSAENAVGEGSMVPPLISSHAPVVRTATEMQEVAHRPGQFDRGVVVQSLLFSKEHFPRVQDAMAWARMHQKHYAAGKDEMPNYWALRQMDPALFDPKTFRTVPFMRGSGSDKAWTGIYARVAVPL